MNSDPTPASQSKLDDAQEDANKINLRSFFPGKPGNAATVAAWILDEVTRIAADLDGSKISYGTLPASPTTLTFQTSIRGNLGTATISTGGTVTASFANQVDLAAGDVLSVVNQATADANGANIALNVKGSRL